MNDWFYEAAEGGYNTPTLYKKSRIKLNNRLHNLPLISRYLIFHSVLI